MESRMNDIYGVRNNVLTECEKMLQYVNIIKNKTDDVINYIKQLNTPNFLKQYAPMYKYLHELNEKLVEQNCQFELFFLESKNSPLTNNDLHVHASTALSQFNDNLLETASKNELCFSATLNEENPDAPLVIKNITNATTENVCEKSTNEQDTVNVDCSVKNSATRDEQVCNNLAETLTYDDGKKNDEGLLNIQHLIEKLNKRSLEKEQEISARIPDLRPVVIATDYYESTSTSEQSGVSSPKRNPKKKSYSNVSKNDDEAEAAKPIKNIVNNIEIKESLVPKEGDLCYVSHIESPSNFYIQIVSDDNSLIDYLSHQIEEVLSCLKLFPTKMEAKKTIEDYCVCYIGKSNTWYRAKILSWFMENDELISVQLIDYGNTCFVPLKNIREAIPYFFALHVMATRCKLAWVKPPNNANEWPNKSIEYFRNMLCSNDENLYFISHVHQDRNKLSVDLQTNGMASLAGDLISNGVAMNTNENEDDDDDDDSDIWCNDFMKDQIIHSQGFSKKELKMTEEEKLQQDLEYIEDDNEEHNDPTLAVAHYRPKDETEICRIFLANGYCFKGDHCRFSHTPLNPEGWTTDRDAVYFEAFDKLVLPEKGEITVKVISIVDLRTYYVVIKDLPQCMMSVTQAIINIKALVKFMNDPAEVKKYKPLKVKPANGELILVKYNNQKWQRGRILECYEYCNRVELDVFLVDFGVVLERINMKTVRTIKEKHLQLPFQAIPCCLANAKMKQNLTEEENDMGSDYLEINILNKKLKARVVYSSSYLNVNLYNEKGNDVGEELIQAGIVEKCPHLIALDSNSHILID